MAIFDVVQQREAPLAVRVAESIEQLVKTKELKAGDRLPNEFELAEELHVGRGTVREAIKQLVAKNVLEIQRGKGTFVAKHPGRMEDPLAFGFVEDQTQLGLDLLEIRMVLEPWIAEQAAIRADEDDIRIIEKQTDLVEEMIRQGIPHLEEDIRLHTAIARASKNQAVPKLVPAINRSVHMLIALTNGELRRETVETHRMVADAIRARDPEKAREAMLKHLQYNRECIYGKMKNGSNSDR